ELANERREIIHMRDERVLLARVRPRGGAEVALGRRDVAVLPRNRLTLAFPGAVIGERSVNEDDRSSLPLVHVPEIHAVDARALDCASRRGHGLATRTAPGHQAQREIDHPNEDRQPGPTRLPCHRDSSLSHWWTLDGHY